MNYGSLKNTARKLISEAGFSATIFRKIKVYNRETGENELQEETSFPVKVVKTSFKKREFEQYQIQANDIKLVVYSDKALKVDDIIQVSEQNYNIKAIEPIAPGNVTLFYTVILGV